MKILSSLLGSDLFFLQYFFFLIMRLLLLAQIHTVAVGAAIGQACLLLAAGSKGKRFMMPHAKGTKLLASFLIYKLVFCYFLSHV